MKNALSCLDAVGPEATPAKHVINTARCSNDHMDTSAKNASVLPNTGATDTSVALDLEVVAERPHDLLDLLS